MYNFVMNNNAQTNGDHEVHNLSNGCSFLPNTENQLSLGYHSDCKGAVSFAKNKWPSARINGCYYCCNSCHTS